MKSTQPLVLGHIALSFHEASAALVRELLLREGVPVELRSAPHEALFAMQSKGEIDLLLSAWLPASHGAYLAPYQDRVEILPELYQPFCLWGVPDYVPEEEVATIEDLLKPNVKLRMRTIIQGINPGAGITRFSQAMMKAYGLQEAGYIFKTGTLEECSSAFTTAVANHEWVVVPLWHPQYLHARHKIRALKEPKGLLGGVDSAHPLLLKSSRTKLPDSAYESLAAFHMGNELLSALDASISLDGENPREAARRFLYSK